MKEMFGQLGTPESNKRQQAFPTAGDHVIANPEKSGADAEIEAGTFAFAEEVLELRAEKR